MACLIFLSGFCLGGHFSTKHLASIILLLDHASFVKTKTKKLLEYSKPMSFLQERLERTPVGNGKSVAKGKSPTPTPTQGRIPTELPGPSALSPLSPCGPHSGISRGRAFSEPGCSSWSQKGNHTLGGSCRSKQIFLPCVVSGSPTSPCLLSHCEVPTRCSL